MVVSLLPVVGVVEVRLVPETTSEKLGEPQVPQLVALGVFDEAEALYLLASLSGDTPQSVVLEVPRVGAVWLPPTKLRPSMGLRE